MLIYFCFLLLFLFLNTRNKGKQKGVTFIKATLLTSLFIVFVTESLSLFHCLNLVFVAICWITVSLALIILLYRNKADFLSEIKETKNKAIVLFRTLSIYEKIIFAFLIIAFLLLFAQGVIYPPNNWDSLTYHLSRIMYWLGNESVAHFPTHILRELYQPPFTEYFILNLNLLNGNDYLANSVQLFFLVNIGITLYCILETLNVNRFLKLVAILILITIPSVELQATNTKNDILCAFFIVTTLFFIVHSLKENSFKNYFFLGLTIGLGLLTKGTAYLFLAPILFCFFCILLYRLFFLKDYAVIKHNLFMAILILVINCGHYSRNYKMNHSLLNVDDTEAKQYSNENMSPRLLFSNLMKNTGLHLGYPIYEVSDSLVRKIHRKINVNIDDQRMNYLGLHYDYGGSKNKTTNEDYAPNTVHLFLGILSFFVLLFGFIQKKDNYVKPFIISILVAIQIILFVGYLKWQPWHTRLHIPVFILSLIPIIITAQLSKWYKRLVYACIPLLMFSFFYYFLYNNLRPILKNNIYTKDIRITDCRFKKYFPNQPYLYDEYAEILDQIYTLNPSKIGLNLKDWEYPLLNSFYYDHLKIVAVNVNNCSKDIPQDVTNIDAIISNFNTPKLVYNGITYVNENKNHLYIWFYKKSSQ